MADGGLILQQPIVCSFYIDCTLLQCCRSCIVALLHSNCSVPDVAVLCCCTACCTACCRCCSVAVLCCFRCCSVADVALLQCCSQYQFAVVDATVAQLLQSILVRNRRQLCMPWLSIPVCSSDATVAVLQQIL